MDGSLFNIYNSGCSTNWLWNPVVDAVDGTNVIGYEMALWCVEQVGAQLPIFAQLACQM